MLWGPCILLCFLLVSPMVLLFNLLFLSKDLSHTERELRECILLYHLHLLRFISLVWIYFACFCGLHLKQYFLILQVAIEFPYVLTQTLIYCGIFYSMASFEWTAYKFLWYIFFMYFTMLYFTFYGMMTTAVTPNHNVAAIIAAPFYMLWNLFSGFMIPHKVMRLSSHCHLSSLLKSPTWHSIKVVLPIPNLEEEKEYVRFECDLFFLKMFIGEKWEKSLMKILWVNQNMKKLKISKLFYSLIHIFLYTEDTYMVEMVLLGKSCGMESLWPRCLAVF